MYPDWVEKFHVKGTTIKKIKDNYYLYKATSRYDKAKGYPISIQKYIGKITKNGVIEPEKISFTPGIDKIVIVSTLIDEISKKDIDVLNKISILDIDGVCYIGKLTSKELKILGKYFKIESNRIWRE